MHTKNTLALFALAALTAIVVIFARESPASAEALEYEEQIIELLGKKYRVRLPRGYRLELLSHGLDAPRMLAFGAAGEAIVGSLSGKVYRIAPPYREAEVLLQLHPYAHGVALRDGELLIGRNNGVYRIDYPDSRSPLSDEDLELLARLPSGGSHTTRTLHVGPDGRIYVGVGISGNCPDEYLDSSYNNNRRRGGIVVLDESGSRARVEAVGSGLRNPVGFAWHPETKVLYASNHGPDHQGFEQPPEYFSRVDPGSYHGMPWFQFDGNRVNPDPCIRSEAPRPREEVARPVATFPARSAPMGVSFVPKGSMDTRLHGDAIVALHGSWATRPTGDSSGNPGSRREPKLVAVRFEQGRAMRVDDLVTGFQLPGGRRWARPVGVTVGPDGALYFTSDQGVQGLFRLSRTQ